MMENLLKIMKAAPGIDDWRVNLTETRSHEAFFVKRRLETLRATDTASASVTVFVDHGGYRGDSSFSLTPAMTEEEIGEKLEKARARALLVKNQPYTLPEAGSLEGVLPDGLSDREPGELLSEIADAVFAAEDGEGATVNALEIFLYDVSRRVVTGSGVDKRESKKSVMIEAIPTFTDEKGSVELYHSERFSSFDPADLTKRIGSRMREVRDRARAEKPASSFTGKVLLGAEEIRELFWTLADDLRYDVAYQHANLHKAGDDLQKDGDGDRLSITLRGRLEGSASSALFDNDGVTLSEVALIEDGAVRALYGPDRFGKYLGIARPAGDLPCLAAKPGSLTREELGKEPYLECVSLSGLQVDLYNDYIGGEIRLAYLHEGEKATPLTGISMSGKLSDALRGMRLSEKTCLRGSYQGPDGLLLPGMTVI